MVRHWLGLVFSLGEFLSMEFWTQVSQQGWLKLLIGYIFGVASVLGYYALTIYWPSLWRM